MGRWHDGAVARPSWFLTLRCGPRVERDGFDSPVAALDALEQRLDALSAAGATRGTIDLRVRTFTPVAQVVARAEVSGPGRWRPAVRGGVDLRGDGSLEAYVGRAQKALLAPENHESCFDALRRAIEGSRSKASPGRAR